MHRFQRYRVADFHCDALSKMVLQTKVNFKNDSSLEVNMERMEQGNIALQAFSVYLPQILGKPTMAHVLAQIKIYYEHVCSHNNENSPLQTLLWKHQVHDIKQTVDQRWGMLTLEGVDGLEANLFYLALCFHLGVRITGFTWNDNNWACDGIVDERNGGLTNQGKALLRYCNDIGMIVDVSHISECGFWDIVDQTISPFIASHSNARAICGHKRNLTDHQIKAIISLDGRIGLTFVPFFVQENGPVHIHHLLHHIEHICALGGEHHLIMGSDFDGITHHIYGLEHTGHFQALVEQLLLYYPESLVCSWISENAFSFLERYLPEKREPNIVDDFRFC